MEAKAGQGIKVKSARMLLIVPLLLCGGSAGLIWYLTRPLPPMAVQIWAIVATLAFPVGLFVGWIFGRRDARLQMDGLDMGVNKVARAAREVVGIRREAPQSNTPPVQVAVLPTPPVVHRQLESGSEVIDL